MSILRSQNWILWRQWTFRILQHQTLAPNNALCNLILISFSLSSFPYAPFLAFCSRSASDVAFLPSPFPVVHWQHQPLLQQINQMNGFGHDTPVHGIKSCVEMSLEWSDICFSPVMRMISPPLDIKGKSQVQANSPPAFLICLKKRYPTELPL